MKEVEDSSLVNHTSTLLLNEFLISKQVIVDPLHSSLSFSLSLVDPTHAHILQQLNMQA